MSNLKGRHMTPRETLLAYYDRESQSPIISCSQLLFWYLLELIRSHILPSRRALCWLFYLLYVFLEEYNFICWLTIKYILQKKKTLVLDTEVSTLAFSFPRYWARAYGFNSFSGFCSSTATSTLWTQCHK